jgi:hypothetical protein
VRTLLRLIGALVVLLATDVVPAAYAATDEIDGGCFILALDTGAASNFATTGILADASVTHDDAMNPLQATVTCWVDVNGVEAPNTRFEWAGLGQQAGFDEVSFVRNGADSVFVCEHVLYADNTTMQTCYPPPTEATAPPQQVQDALRGALDVVNPTVCPVLAAHAGDYPGGVEITSSGDVFVDSPVQLFGSPVYDCPPYSNSIPTVVVIAGPVRT